MSCLHVSLPKLTIAFSCFLLAFCHRCSLAGVIFVIRIWLSEIRSTTLGLCYILWHWFVVLMSCDVLFYCFTVFEPCRRFIAQMGSLWDLCLMFSFQREISNFGVFCLLTLCFFQSIFEYYYNFTTWWNDTSVMCKTVTQFCFNFL